MFRSVYELLGQYDPSTHLFTPKTWSVKHRPGTNVQATATRAAASKTGQRLVATSITVTFTAGTSAPSANSITVSLIDGASGGGTTLWGPHDISIPAVAGAMNGIALPCWIVGSANTAMTLEFSAAGGANTFESVTLTGVTV